MTWDPDGQFVLRSQAAILADIAEQAKVRIEKPNLSAGGTIGKVFAAFAALPLDEAQQDIANLRKQMFPSTADLPALKKHLQDFAGFQHRAALRSAGTLNITFNSALDTGDYDPFISAGEIVLVDSDGNKYDLIANIVLGASPSTTTTGLLQAQIAGADGNISADQIVGVEFLTSQASTRWNAEVASFTNDAAFTGGRDAETAAEYYSRFREKKAARPDASPTGIEAGLLDAGIGVTDVDVIENENLTPTTDDTPFTFSGTGTASETINGTTTQFALRIEVFVSTFIAGIVAKLSSDTALVGDWKIKEDSPGEPSATEVNTNLRVTGADFDGTNETIFLFDNNGGAYLEPGVYWAEFTRTSGSGAFDGDVTAELVTNGGFETYTTSPGDPDDWTTFNDGTTDPTVEKETTIIDAGSNAVKITVQEADVAQGIEQTLAGLSPGLQNTVSARARTSGVAGEVPTLTIYDVTDDAIVATATGTDAGVAYETLSATFTPEADHSYRVRVGTASADAVVGDILYFDEVSVALDTVNAKVNAGVWAEDTNIDAARMDIIGGIPGRNFRAVVVGGTDQSVGDTLRILRPAGVKGDGSTIVTVDIEGGTDTQRFSRPTTIPIVISVTVTSTSLFGGDEDTVRNAITDYINNLPIRGKVVRNEIISRLLEDDRILGLEDVTECLLARQSLRATPAALLAGDTANLSMGSGELARIIDEDADISVTINAA